MKEIIRVIIGWIAALITIILIKLFDIPFIYNVIVVLIFAVWSLIPNKYFYVLSKKFKEVNKNV